MGDIEVDSKMAVVLSHLVRSFASALTVMLFRDVSDQLLRVTQQCRKAWPTTFNVVTNCDDAKSRGRSTLMFDLAMHKSDANDF